MLLRPSSTFPRSTLPLGEFRLPPLDGMQTESRLGFLFKTVSRHGKNQVGRALEIGCYKAASTVVLAQACHSLGIADISSIDLFTGTAGWNQTFDTWAAARQRIREFGFGSQVHLIRGDSRDVAWYQTVDVLHIDGDHSYEAVRSDIQRFTPFVVVGGMILFDDYDSSHDGVMRAVDEFLGVSPGMSLLARHDDGPAGGSVAVRRDA